ncbi:DUF1877 family protein [Iodobacter sp. CM08]|uniref:DUF1877 family protein n=1 Tax=Iodobacter sp. CM08 TaxID=3085902 RepID=UPI002981D798|nr:DUF1877 family protein [Iodobacter sp. CM08]MDW5417075.1 DUF1877 family protein [Iodobacter sp. CM08]
MSMIGNFLAIPQDELDALYDESGEIAAVLDGEYAAQIIDIDKAWHGIHFMLTENNAVSSPLAHAVLGIKKIGEEDVGYGPAHGISAASVKEIARGLNAHPINLSNMLFVGRVQHASHAEKTRVSPALRCFLAIDRSKLIA